MCLDSRVTIFVVVHLFQLESCLEAFSTSETLDASNPWFCPVCRKNQCATKTLTVWRFPDFLIVYLKR
jgi:ubiquitin C-terminal hydrolase